jgi:hypothetical protein
MWLREVKMTNLSGTANRDGLGVQVEKVQIKENLDI